MYAYDFLISQLTMYNSNSLHSQCIIKFSAPTMNNSISLHSQCIYSKSLNSQTRTNALSSGTICLAPMLKQ